MEIVISNLQQKMTQMQALERIVTAVLKKAAELYGLEETVEVSVVLADDVYIRRLNLEYRGKDCATDVLSFALNEGGEPQIVDGPALNLLGDIVISLERAAEQATEYGHGLERELAFLTVHGMLHLLGYDHEQPEDQAEMRQEEEFILEHLGITRDYSGQA